MHLKSLGEFNVVAVFEQQHFVECELVPDFEGQFINQQQSVIGVGEGRVVNKLPATSSSVLAG